MINFNTGVMRESYKVCRLEAADVLLVHTKRSIWGWLIRFGTHCYWNHALMVCFTGDAAQGYHGVLVVDAKTSGSIVMRRASQYLNNSHKYDVAVKRLETGWFRDGNQALDADFRSHICNTAVNEVDFNLGMRSMEYIDQIIRQLTVIFRFVRRKIGHIYTPPKLPWTIRPIELKAFTCGGFVQWCFYKGVSRVIAEKETDASCLKEVIFNPKAKKEPTPFELLNTTPADLANSETLAWKYIVKDGMVQEVSSSKEVTLATTSA